MFISSIIFPLFDSCCLVYNNLTAEQNIKLQRLINCGIIFIFDFRRDWNITPNRRRLVWVTVESRRLYFLGIMTFRISHGIAPGYLLELFCPAVPCLRPSRRLTPIVFVTPNFCMSTYRNSFLLSTIYFWHSLPPCMFLLSGWISSSSSNIFFRGRLGSRSVFCSLH